MGRSDPIALTPYLLAITAYLQLNLRSAQPQRMSEWNKRRILLQVYTQLLRRFSLLSAVKVKNTLN
jgi:hypothetical protein